jgi:hypothetical protein
LKKKAVKNFTTTCLNHIVIECKVNGIKSRLIVDTGASNSCINYFSASKFNIAFKKSNEKASSATDQIIDTFFSKNNILQIDDFRKANFEIILFDMSYINNSLREKEIEEVDGILGGDILNEFDAKINYEKKLLTLKF